MELKTILLPTLNASPAKRGDLLINGIGELVIVDYDDSVACGVDLFLCSTLNVKNGDWAFDLVYKRIVKIKSVKDDFVALDVEEGLTHSNISNLRKIEFTTDPKLIADGVPKIDGKTKALIKNPNPMDAYMAMTGIEVIEVNFLAEFCNRYNQKDNQKVEEDFMKDMPLSIGDQIIENLKKQRDARFSLEDMVAEIRKYHKWSMENREGENDVDEYLYYNLITKESKSKMDIVIECEMEETKCERCNGRGRIAPVNPLMAVTCPDCNGVVKTKIKLKDGQPILTFK